MLAVCPGPTESKFFEAAEFPTASAGSSQKPTAAEEVVKEALQALAAKQSNVVTGCLGNWLLSNVPRVWPRQSLVTGVAKVMQPSKAR